VKRTTILNYLERTMATATRKPIADRIPAQMPPSLVVTPRPGKSSEKQQLLQATLDAISKAQAVIEFSLDGIIENANENFLRTMGYRLDEIRGQHHSMFMDAVESQGPEYRIFWEALKRGEGQTREFRRYGKAGREVWLQASYTPLLDGKGRPYKVIKVASDITEQKRLNANYQGQLAAIGRSQAVIEFLPDGTILTANENFLACMGYTLAEIRDRHHSMFVDEAERGLSRVLGRAQSRGVPELRVQALRQGRPRGLDSGLVQPDLRRLGQGVQGGEVCHRRHGAEAAERQFSEPDPGHQ
jgi:PAS domain S-box-containing protein